MINSVRCILALCVVYMPVFVILGMGRFPKITRKQFAAMMASALGLQLFLLTVMFVQDNSIVVAVILFILAFPGVYPIAYMYYPRYKARIEKRKINNS